MFWVIFWATIAGITGLLTIFLAAYWVRVTVRGLTDENAKKLHRLKIFVRYWAVMGTVFGVAGSALTMRINGIGGYEAAFWLVMGAIVGSLWGAIWGAVWSVTSRG